MSNILYIGKLNKKLVLFLSIFCFLFFSNIAQAASLNLSPSSGSYSVGDTINVRVVLVSPSQSANAVSGTISFPKNILTLNSISKSNSLISIWAVEPTFSNGNGTANMEGVILSGYAGSNGNIITLSFKAKSVGEANIKFTSSAVLANDGQGTNILTDTGEANFEIFAATEKTNTISSKKTSIQIQEIKKKDEMSSTAKFLVTSVGKKLMSSFKIEIDGLEYPWVNSTSNIFETPQLPKGLHNIKVFMETVENSTIFDSVSFSINSILMPTFTEYSENITEKEYIVAKGLVDPNIDVVINPRIISNTGQTLDGEIVTITSNDKGIFTYVSSKAIAGIYDITAHSVTKSGVKSEESLPIRIKVLANTPPVSISIMNTFSVLVPILALLVVLVLLVIWGWYKALHLKEYLGKRLAHTKILVKKSFDILDEDVQDEMKVIKKIKALQPLTEEERSLIDQLQKDVQSAEKTILEDIK